MFTWTKYSFVLLFCQSLRQMKHSHLNDMFWLWWKLLWTFQLLHEVMLQCTWRCDITAHDQRVIAVWRRLYVPDMSTVFEFPSGGRRVGSGGFRPLTAWLPACSGISAGEDVAVKGPGWGTDYGFSRPGGEVVTLRAPLPIGSEVIDALKTKQKRASNEWRISPESNPSATPFAFQDFPRESANTGRDLVQIQTVKHSITATSTGVRDHKRALESSVGDSLTPAVVEVEASCVQGALRDALAKLSASGEVSPGVTELKQTWQKTQVKNHLLAW